MQILSSSAATSIASKVTTVEYDIVSPKDTTAASLPLSSSSSRSPGKKKLRGKSVLMQRYDLGS